MSGETLRKNHLWNMEVGKADSRGDEEQTAASNRLREVEGTSGEGQERSLCWIGISSVWRQLRHLKPTGWT